MKILLFDNYDSFTYNLRDYLLQCGVEVITVRNDEMPLEKLLAMPFDGVVISPGPSSPAETTNLMELLAEACGKMPVLGICLGFQAIGLHFGAMLKKAPLPVHGKTSLLKYKPHAMFEGLSGALNVCRYHSLVLDEIPAELEITATTEDLLPMSFAHTRLNIWGHQFHPEAILSEGGLTMIKNWIDHITVHNI